MDDRFSLPQKVEQFLATLNQIYGQQGRRLLQELIVNSTVSIEVARSSDSWNGGTYGHAVTLLVPQDLFIRSIGSKGKLQSRIVKDLNKLHPNQNEHFCDVFIELQDQVPENWREDSEFYRPTLVSPPISDQAMARIWGASSIRVFLSHKSSVKLESFELKKSLEHYGIAAFVAHEDIEPTQEWQREIERALHSMSVLVAILTHDFHDSNWTDQEVGFALGRGVPVIGVRLGRDPYGLMGKSQGLGGCDLKNPDHIALKLFGLLCKGIVEPSHLFECALTAYSRSSSFENSAANIERLFAHFENLNEEQVEKVVEAFRQNGQNRHSFRGRDLLLPLLKRWTGVQWAIVKDNLCREDTLSELSDAHIPF